MELIRSRAAMQRRALELQRDGVRLGFVPTMGALHAGHLALVRKARPGCDLVAASIFVNPLQFGPGEDFDRYPRDLERDLALLEREGCGLVFAPQTEEMYAPEARTHVEVRELQDVLCGRSRPGHFRGVATVVAKLLHVVQPAVVVFGQKDAQQAILLRRMLLDLDWPVEMRVAAIVREQDGLALSSRNAFLSAEERREAPLLHAALRAALRLIEAGERRSAIVIERARDLLERRNAAPGRLPRDRRHRSAAAAGDDRRRRVDRGGGVLRLHTAHRQRGPRGAGRQRPRNGASGSRRANRRAREGSMSSDLVAIILAAGVGKRMGSSLPKVLHPVLGRPMLDHVLDAVRGAGVQRTVVVVGHQAERVRTAVAGPDVEFALQAEQLGTGHAVLQTKPLLAGESGTAFVLCGDTPLLGSETLLDLLATHREARAAATVLSAVLEDATGYGRILREADGSVRGIVEHKDATEAEREVREINSGLFAFSLPDLFAALSEVRADNAQGEYYLTDTLAILLRRGRRVAARACRDPREVLGVNTMDQLREVEAIMQARVRHA